MTVSAAAAILLVATTVAPAQHHPVEHHHHPPGGVHPPHYPGVPHHARDVVRVHAEHEPVDFYWLDHHSHVDPHGHRDYYCLHDGHRSLIRFGSRSHVHDLAHGLRDIMVLADRDMVANYRGNPGFETTHHEMHQFMECASRLDNAANQGNYDEAIDELRHFSEDLNHLSSDVRHWHRYGHSQIGRGGLLTKVADAHAIIMHLRNDLGYHGHHPHH